MVIVVEIEDRCAEKAFLGGWKNVVTGTVYEDACTQTCPAGDRICSKKHLTSGRCAGAGAGVDATRTATVTTQTHNGNGSDAREKSVGGLASCSKLTSCVPGSTERATQTSRLPDLRDKLVEPRGRRESSCVAHAPCETERSRRHCRDDSEDEKRRLSRLEDECSAVKIQECYRDDRRARTELDWQPAEKVEHLGRHCQFEIVNAPQCSPGRSDLEMLENVLGRWRVYENARIDQSLFGTSKLAARTTLLLKEIHLRRSIEAIRSKLNFERRQRRYLEDLDNLAHPEIWNLTSGKKIHVYTLRVQRARECRDFYAMLMRVDCPTSERIVALTSLKRYTMGHSCPHGRDLLSLVDQELELIAHSANSAELFFLRNRTRLALLRLSRNFSEPQRSGGRDEKSRGRRKIYGRHEANSKLCNRCGRFFHLDDFPAFRATWSGSFVTCEKCANLRPGKEPKVVYEPYKLMLEELESREKICLAVEPRVICRLVNHVWHGKSGISECTDLFRLRLVRFRPEREWSPWNNLVLTEPEADLHRSMPDPWRIYAPSLVKKFVIKNLQAKLRFDHVIKSTFSS